MVPSFPIFHDWCLPFLACLCFFNSRKDDYWNYTFSSLRSILVHLCHHPQKSRFNFLGLILIYYSGQEIRVISDKVRADDDAANIENDWKFAAMVLDRICLITFSLFTIIATIVVLAAAPHVIVKWKSENQEILSVHLLQNQVFKCWIHVNAKL